MQPMPTTAQAPSRVAVAIVEDDAGFLDALRQAVRTADDLRLSGVAATRADGLALLDGPPADVLLVDLGLPDGSGIDIIRAAAQRWPECAIMVSSSFGDETHVMRSIEAGAAGYLLKDSAPVRIVDEIRSLAAGGSPISPIIARQILLRFRDRGTDLTPPPMAETGPAGTEAPEETPSLLSPREKEVLSLITKGFTTVEVARMLDLSHFTVRTFVRRIYSKLEVTSKAEAIYEARTLGLLNG
ncbi:response regulator [Nitrospirillum amazonense]|uniref:LuxR family two component transcriptional regulator n=1 Tax=Nitrospirillum amazonense TaxID=28077 RepID=A0A560JI15_9PROT|nr:response regulator transcription factor [Nitrospirillum amazonense]MDG3439622.1 response regulator transcription factor [Nitrospirillum amazonense]TWB70666.1 LuxR family two component transcriptional regulator [Nitrospirillum amazonense]